MNEVKMPALVRAQLIGTLKQAINFAKTVGSLRDSFSTEEALVSLGRDEFDCVIVSIRSNIPPSRICCEFNISDARALLTELETK